MTPSQDYIDGFVKCCFDRGLSLEQTNAVFTRSLQKRAGVKTLLKALGLAGVGGAATLGGMKAYNATLSGDNMIGRWNRRKSPLEYVSELGQSPSVPDWAKRDNVEYGGLQDPYGLPGEKGGKRTGSANLLQAALDKRDSGIAASQIAMDKMRRKAPSTAQRAYVEDDPVYQALGKQLESRVSDKANWRSKTIGEYNQAMQGLTGGMGASNSNMNQLTRQQREYDDWVRNHGTNTNLGNATLTGRNGVWNTVLNKWFGTRKPNVDTVQTLLEQNAAAQRGLSEKQYNVTRTAAPIF